MTFHRATSNQVKGTMTTYDNILLYYLASEVKPLLFFENENLPGSKSTTVACVFRTSRRFRVVPLGDAGGGLRRSAVPHSALPGTPPHAATSFAVSGWAHGRLDTCCRRCSCVPHSACFLREMLTNHGSRVRQLAEVNS